MAAVRQTSRIAEENAPKVKDIKALSGVGQAETTKRRYAAEAPVSPACSCCSSTVNLSFHQYRALGDIGNFQGVTTRSQAAKEMVSHHRRHRP